MSHIHTKGYQMANTRDFWKAQAQDHIKKDKNTLFVDFVRHEYENLSKKNETDAFWESMKSLYKRYDSNTAFLKFLDIMNDKGMGMGTDSILVWLDKFDFGKKMLLQEWQNDTAQIKQTYLYEQPQIKYQAARTADGAYINPITGIDNNPFKTLNTGENESAIGAVMHTENGLSIVENKNGRYTLPADKVKVGKLHCICHFKFDWCATYSWYNDLLFNLSDVISLCYKMPATDIMTLVLLLYGKDTNVAKESANQIKQFRRLDGLMSFLQNFGHKYKQDVRLLKESRDLGYAIDVQSLCNHRLQEITQLKNSAIKYGSDFQTFYELEYPAEIIKAFDNTVAKFCQYPICDKRLKPVVCFDGYSKAELEKMRNKALKQEQDAIEAFIAEHGSWHLI